MKEGLMQVGKVAIHSLIQYATYPCKIQVPGTARTINAPPVFQPQLLGHGLLPVSKLTNEVGWWINLDDIHSLFLPEFHKDRLNEVVTHPLHLFRRPTPRGKPLITHIAFDNGTMFCQPKILAPRGKMDAAIFTKHLFEEKVFIYRHSASSKMARTRTRPSSVEDWGAFTSILTFTGPCSSMKSTSWTPTTAFSWRMMRFTSYGSAAPKCWFCSRITILPPLRVYGGKLRDVQTKG